MSPPNRFHVIDYVVFGATLALSVVIGLIFAFRGGQSNTQEYLMGNRKMKLIPVAISLMVSFLSTIGILGNPAEVYAYGTQFMLSPIALTIGMVIGSFTFVPLLYPLKITSVYEYHRMRFKRLYLEIFVILLSIIVATLYNAIVLFSPCVAFEGVSGFPAWASMLISGFGTIFYTTLGGMQAVVWTDCFQAVIIIAGLATILIKGTMEVGGVKEVWQINNAWGRVDFFNFSFDPTVRMTFWSVVLMNSLLWMTILTAQPSVQRFMALPTLRKAKLSTMIVIPGFVFSGLMTSACGATAFAYYAKRGCDPVSAGIIRNPNQILPFFVMDVLDIPSLPGLFIACLFSASISTLSSSYSAFGGILWQNVLSKRYGHLSPKKQTNITKLATLVYGIVCIGCAFIFMNIGGTLIQITFSVIGGVGGPLIAISLVAALFPRVGPRGVVVGGVLSVMFCTWLSLGATMSNDYIMPLPGPVYNCTFPPGPGNGSTGAPGYNMTGEDTLAGRDSAPQGLSMVGNSASMGTGKTGLAWMYSISYFYYPIIGMVIVTTVSLIFSVIPHLEETMAVPKKLLFPCVRSCCGLENPEDEDPDSKETVSKDAGSQGFVELMKNSLKDYRLNTMADGHNSENSKYLLEMEPKDDDVWILRNDVKHALNGKYTVTESFMETV